MKPLLTASALIAALLWLLASDAISSLCVLCQGIGHYEDQPPPPSYQQPEPPQSVLAPPPSEDGKTVIATLMAPSVGVIVVVGSLGILVLLVILIVSTETPQDRRDNREEGCREVVAMPPSAFRERNMKKIYVQPPSTDAE